MSSHSFPKIDQKEYLKKYLSGDKVKKKKKDKKHKKLSVSAKVKIIDDDINHFNSGPEIDEELLLTGDDAPQIVGEYIEEEPADKKVPKWKSIVIKDEPEDEQNDNDLWGRKSAEVRVKQEFSSEKSRSKRALDKSPPRRRDRKREPALSPATSRHKSPSPQVKSKREKSPRYRKNNLSPNRITKIKEEPQSPVSNESKSSLLRKNGRSYSSDVSPPRRRNSDQSPPRRGKSPRKLSPDQLPTKHRRSSDQSPPRRAKSPKRKIKSPSPRRWRSPDQSPPRRRRRSSDQSPPRRHKTDQSPARRPREINHSPVRKSRNSFESDQSPPRRKRNLDQSPVRRNRKSPPTYSKRSPDQSPPRRKRDSHNESHRNPPLTQIKREKRTPDLSPPRSSRWKREESEKSHSPPPTHKPKPQKTLEGKKAGLQDAKSLQKETMERRRREDVLFETMSTEISGRNAEVQVRSTGRRGERARESAKEDPEERRRRQEHEEKKKNQYDRWGKGLKQIEDHKKRMLEQEYESSKPLARYSNDEDLERHLKEQERAEDPMLEYMRKKRKEKEKASGKPQIPRYEGPFPENRFGIRPGYRWDGVDRSNGYEKKWFAAQNERKAGQEEAYKYSVADM